MYFCYYVSYYAHLFFLMQIETRLGIRTCSEPAGLQVPLCDSMIIHGNLNLAAILVICNANQSDDLFCVRCFSYRETKGCAL